MYHLSDIKKYERCPKAFWLSQRVEKQFVPYVNFNENLTDLVKDFLMLREEDIFYGQPNDPADLALEAMKNHKVLIQARFEYHKMRIKVPFLIQENEKTILYFTYHTCYPREKEAEKIAQHLAILKKLGIQIDEVYVIHLNAGYVRGKELNLHELLVISEYLYNGKNKPHKTIKELLDEQLVDIDAYIEELDHCNQLTSIPSYRDSKCTRTGKCPYFDDCFPDPLPNDSILHLAQDKSKYEMLEEGKTTLQDVDIDKIEGTRYQYVQIMAARNHGMFVDKQALRYWLKNTFQEPISYLDFEWETYVYPPYEGMKPYDVLVFQYSLHIEDNGQLQHVGFIGEKDCRKAFIEHLIAHIPKTGSIVVYNMEGAEKLRLTQLAHQFPEYEEQLRQIWERMVDLSLPFSTGNIYDLKMAGHYSLKTLVPIFSDYTYSDLDISYGIDAVEKWRAYVQASGEEKQIIYKQLEEYCGMDTYAEYIVYHALKDLAENC